MSATVKILFPLEWLYLRSFTSLLVKMICTQRLVLSSFSLQVGMMDSVCKSDNAFEICFFVFSCVFLDLRIGRIIFHF